MKGLKEPHVCDGNKYMAVLFLLCLGRPAKDHKAMVFWPPLVLMMVECQCIAALVDEAKRANELSGAARIPPKRLAQDLPPH